MKSPSPRILTSTAARRASSSRCSGRDSLRRLLEGGIERIGLPEATLRVKGLDQADNFSRA